MLFEGLKEKGSLMIVPSSAIDSLNLGGLAALGMHTSQQGGMGGGGGELPQTNG